MSTMQIVQTIVCLQERPHTVNELVDKVGRDRDSVRTLLKTLRESGYVDTMGWGQKGKTGSAPMLWGWRK